MKLNRFRNLRPAPYQQPQEEEIQQFEPIPEDQYQQSQPPPQQYEYEQPQQQELTPELIQEIQRMQMEEQMRQQQMQQGIPVQPMSYKPEVPDNKGDNPLSILDEIKARPSPKGTFPMVIGGRPVDLHVLEDYITKISPFALKTILRYHNARTIEELKGYSNRGSLKLKSGTIMLILVAIGLAVGGIIMLMYMPQIMGIFKGMGI